MLRRTLLQEQQPQSKAKERLSAAGDLLAVFDAVRSHYFHRVYFHLISWKQQTLIACSSVPPLISWIDKTHHTQAARVRPERRRKADGPTVTSRPGARPDSPTSGSCCPRH